MIGMLPGGVTSARGSRTLKVLLVEDNGGDALLVRSMLDDVAPSRFEIVHAVRLADGVRGLLDGGFDCVLLDLSLPDAQGLDGLGQVRTVATNVPVIVLSGGTDEELAVGAVAAGAQDYLVKGETDPKLLARSINYAIERKRAEVELAHLALHDQLTGLPNRALFHDRLGQALTRLGRSERSVAVLFCDLDRFKVVNDSLGHEAGDLLLLAVAQRLAGVLRAGDTAARFGGDEFVVLCEDVADAGHAVRVAERLSASLTAPFKVGDEEVYVHTSIGIALAAEPGLRPEVLIRDADAAMYRAKERGGGGFEVFDAEMRERMVRRMSVEHALHRAIERDELRLHYQPQVRMTTGDVVGVEALVRWQHPDRGLLGPDEFIGAAEETGLIHELGAWVLETACNQLVRWEAGGRRMMMSVNLSVRQLHNPELVHVVGAILGQTGADPASLCLEVTETAVMEDMEAMGRVLTELKTLGITLAIDDFGTGYSSLRALQLLPFDVVKIDRSFIRDLPRSEQGAAIAAAVVSLAHALGLAAVAEGIEELPQLERLRALGCDVGQGFYFSEPREPGALGYGLGGAT